MRHVAFIGAVIALVPAATARASDGAAGGLEAPSRPAIERVSCSAPAEDGCPRGAQLRFAGEGLQTVAKVRFLGKPGKADDRQVRPASADAHELVVAVPRSARSGPLEVRANTGVAAVSAVRISSRTTVSSGEPQADGGWVFPLRGKHDYGSATNRFGGGRGHQAQDILAACGTPIVAARDGKVIKNTFHSRAGNYLVLQHADGRSTAYMHMRAPAEPKTGERVVAGQTIGFVGQTGRASACHLHFELWTAPGWYRGGSAVDPLPILRAAER